LVQSKQTALRYDKRFNIRKLIELEVRKQYQIKISDSFAAWENLNDSGDINGTGENTKEHKNPHLKRV
jgi:hypothetical protein